MPWTADDAATHTSKASTPRLARLWADVANRVLGQTGDDVTAIRKANAAVARATGANRASEHHARKAAARSRQARGFSVRFMR